METREEILERLWAIKADDDAEMLIFEIIADAMIEMQYDEKLKPLEALERGYKEWVKRLGRNDPGDYGVLEPAGCGQGGFGSFRGIPLIFIFIKDRRLIL